MDSTKEEEDYKHPFSKFITQALTHEGTALIIFDPYNNLLQIDKVKVAQELELQGAKNVKLKLQFVSFSYNDKNSKIRFVPYGHYQMPGKKPYLLGEGTTVPRGAIGVDEMSHFMEMLKENDIKSWWLIDLWSYNLVDYFTVKSPEDELYFKHFYNHQDELLSLQEQDAQKVKYRNAKKKSDYVFTKNPENRKRKAKKSKANPLPKETTLRFLRTLGLSAYECGSTY